MPSIYSTLPSGTKIDSRSYLRNDNERKATVTLSDLQGMTLRDFDTAPTVMSSEFMEKGEMVRDSILGAYTQYGADAGQDPYLRQTLDLAMSLVLNKPLEQVMHNHDAYKRIFTGQDLDDKTLGQAMVDAWDSDSVSSKISALQRRKDATDDPDEILRLEEQMVKLERDLARLGDYSPVRSWFGDRLVKAAAIAPQVMDGAIWSGLYALAFAGLSAVLTPAGAGAVLAPGAAAGASNILGWIRGIASTAAGAASLGARAGTASYLAQQVFPREYGSMSRQLEQAATKYELNMDKETRKKAASIYAVASTLIEFMTPEPGLGKLLYGVAPKQFIKNSFLGWLKRVGVNTLQGGLSESLEEVLQDFVGSLVEDIALPGTSRQGATDFTMSDFVNNLPDYVSSAWQTFKDTFVPSMIVGLPGAVTSSSVAAFLTDVTNEHDLMFHIISDDARASAMSTQKVERGAQIVSSNLIDMPTQSVADFANEIEGNGNAENITSEKFDDVKVRLDRKRGRYVPIDEKNAKLAKYLNVYAKNDAISVRVVNDGTHRTTMDDIENAVENAGGAVRNGTEVIFKDIQSAAAFAQSMPDTVVLIDDGNGSYSFEYTDTDGNVQVEGITIDENANIDGIVEAENRRRGIDATQGPSAANVQPNANAAAAEAPIPSDQTTVESMAKAIRNASRGHITENASNALAKLFDMMPEDVKNAIFTRNNGQLIITDSEYERITGRKLNPKSRAAAWLNNLQMILTGRSDASSFVHEMGHLALVIEPQLAEDIRLAFSINTGSQESIDILWSFIQENKDIIRVKDKAEAERLLKELGNLDKGQARFSEAAEELLMSMLEAHFRTDLRADNMTTLPKEIRDVFQKVANAIRRVYGRATGKTDLPMEVQEVFNSFFWNGTAPAQTSTANSTQTTQESEFLTNNEVIRDQPMREGYEQRKIEYQNRILEWLRGEDIKKYKHMKRSEIIAETGGYQRFPVAEMPVEAMEYFGVDDQRIYSNRGYFIDHAVNRHPNLNVGDYLAMLDTFSSNSPAADILIDDKSVNKALIFIDKIDGHWFKGIAELDSDTNQVVLYLTYFNTGKEKPGKGLESIKQEPSVFVTHPIGQNQLDSAAVDISDLHGSSTQTISSGSEDVNRMSQGQSTEIDDIKHQQEISEDSLENGQRKYIHMSDERFVRAIDKDIFLPEYVVKAKLNSEDDEVVSKAKQELDDRDKFSIMSPADISAIYDTDSVEEYLERMNASGTLNLAEEGAAERVYRKAWEYAHVMTPKEAVNSFKQRFGTLPGLMELKKILGPRQVLGRTASGRTYTRTYVPASNSIFRKLSRLTTDSPISEINEVLQSMDSNPREWLRAYQSAVNSGARIRGTLAEDQDIIDNYVNMADSDFSVIKNELRRGEEPYGVSYETVYGVSDEEIVDLSVEEAEKRTAGESIEGEGDLADDLKKTSLRLRDSYRIAKGAAEAATNRARQLETEMDEARQAFSSERTQLTETLIVLRKTVHKRTAEVESLKKKLANATNRENQQRSEYAARLRAAEKEIRESKKLADEAENRLNAAKASFDKRMADMKDKLAVARKEAHDQNIRANKLQRRLEFLATKAESDRITRSIKSRLNLNSKRHDRAMLEDSLYYVYYLIRNGQNRAFSSTRSTEEMPDLDWQMETLRNGLSEGMQQMDADGNVTPIAIDLGGFDKDGNPIVAYSGNLAAYRYRRQEIPEPLRKHLSQGTIDALESPGKLTWNSLTVRQKRDINDALQAVKREAAISRETMNDNRLFERRTMAREAAQAVLSSDIGEITDEMREETRKRMVEKDPSYSKVPSDEEVWDFIAKHPDAYIEGVAPSRAQEAFDSFSLSFLKIQRIARFLDDGKDDGPFQRIFVRRFQEGYDQMMRNIDRRSQSFYSSLEAIIGKKGTKEYSARLDDLRRKRIPIKTRAIINGQRDMTYNEAMAMWNYSQNILGATKLVSSDGNNLTMEELARINPSKTLEYINLELKMRKDPGRDSDHPTPFAHEDEASLNRIASSIVSGEISESIIPEWVRQVGDLMIDELAKETPRLAEAAHNEFNVMLEIQDRYFPLVQASRGSWGDILQGNKKKGVQSVNAGSLKTRLKSARYPLMLDPFAVFFSAIREQENLINMARPVSDAGYLLKHGDVENIVKNRFGSKWANALNDYVSRIAAPQNSLTDVEKLMNRVFGNAAAAKIGLNLMTGLKQFVSLIPAITEGDLKASDVVRGFSHMFHRSESMKVMDNLAYSVLRSGYDADISRLQGIEDSSRLNRFNQKFVDVTTWLVQRGDELSKIFVWMAKYDQQMRLGRSEADAAYAATDLVNRTMSVTSPIAMSQMQANRNPFARAFFMFTTDLFQMWNIGFGDIRIDLQNKDYAKAFKRFGGLAASAAMLALLAGGWLPDKDDDDDKMFSTADFVGDFIENMLGYALPLIGQQASDWMNGYTQDFIELPREVVSTGQMVYQGITGDKEYTPEQYMERTIDTLLSLGEMAGVPGYGLKRPFQAVRDEDTGEWRINLGYLFGTRWGDGMDNLLSQLVN